MKKKSYRNFTQTTKVITDQLKKSINTHNKLSILYKMKQELSFWAKLLNLLDIPSGSILGLFTLQMFLMMWIAFFTHYDIKTSILTAYGSVLAGFTVHSVSQTMSKKSDEDE